MPDTVASFNRLETALAYFRLGYSPIPLCDPEHKYVWKGHRDGYTNKEGRQVPPCTSPGKAPVTKAWYQWATGSMTEADVRNLFQRHHGNIGLALRRGQFVLDIDPRAGGFEALALLEQQYGPLPETPMVGSGGGGQHLYFIIPEDVEIPSGGTLTDKGYPGVEWKTHTERAGQVVAPPSLHVSGKVYVWDVAQKLGRIPPAPVPHWLLSMIQEKAAKERPQGVSLSNPSQARYTQEQVVGFFQRTYAMGERRVQSTGLPRLIGILRSRGVSALQAIEFLQRWQADHFAPPLSEEDIEAHVLSMYQRYGSPPEDREDGGDRFVAWLGRELTRLANTENVGVREVDSNGHFPNSDIQADSKAAADGEYDPAIYAKWKAEADRLIPVVSGVVPETSFTMSLLKGRAALLRRQVFSNTWRNPVNCAVKKKRIIAHAMTKMEMEGIASAYRYEVAEDDWGQKKHESLLLKAKRASVRHYSRVDNSIMRRSLTYYFTDDIPGLEGLERLEGLEAICNDFAICIADIEPPDQDSGPQRFRPVKFCKDWNMPRPKDKNKADFVGFRTGVDDEFEAARAAGSGINTWLQPGDQVFEAGERRLFTLDKKNADALEALGAGEEGKIIELLVFTHKTLGYILTTAMWERAYPGHIHPSKLEKESGRR